MAEEQVAEPLRIEKLEITNALIGCTSLLSQLYIKNLADLRNIDASCESKSAEKLAQLIWFYKREALEPIKEGCRNNEVVSQLRYYIETIEYSMKQICEAYRARTRQEFETKPRYISSLSTIELLLRVVIETQIIKDIGRPSLYIISINWRLHAQYLRRQVESLYFIHDAKRLA